MSDDTKMRARIEIIVGWLRQGAWPVGEETAAAAADIIERLERELAETRVDRDLHYSRCASLIFSEPFSKVTSAEIQKWHREYVADRDALAERCEKLREALRRNAVKDGYCAECSERPDWRTWVGTNPERHAEGCLAAPKDAP